MEARAHRLGGVVVNTTNTTQANDNKKGGPRRSRPVLQFEEVWQGDRQAEAEFVDALLDLADRYEASGRLATTCPRKPRL